MLLAVAFFLIRNVFRIKRKGRNDLMVENIRTFGAAILLLILAIGFFTTDKDFCELVLFFCR